MRIRQTLVLVGLLPLVASLPPGEPEKSVEDPLPPFAALRVENDPDLALRYAPPRGRPAWQQALEHCEDCDEELDNGDEELDIDAPESDAPALKLPQADIKDDAKPNKAQTTAPAKAIPAAPLQRETSECGCPAIDHLSPSAGPNRTDAFISYRRATDNQTAERLAFRLEAGGRGGPGADTETGVKVWWDAKDLQDGELWKDGMCRGVQSANFFVSVLSEDGLASLQTMKEGDVNNMLMELETAMQVMDETKNPHFIIPVCVGKYVKAKQGGMALRKFQGFDSDVFPDVHSGSCGARTIRQTLARLFDIQCIPVDPEDMACGVGRLVRRLHNDPPHVQDESSDPEPANPKTQVTSPPASNNVTVFNRTRHDNVTRPQSNSTINVTRVQPNATTVAPQHNATVDRNVSRGGNATASPTRVNATSLDREVHANFTRNTTSNTTISPGNATVVMSNATRVRLAAARQRLDELATKYMAAAGELAMALSDPGPEPHATLTAATRDGVEDISRLLVGLVKQKEYRPPSSRRRRTRRHTGMVN